MTKIAVVFKIIVITLVLISASFDGNPNVFHTMHHGKEKPIETYVYICTGPNATRYHSSSKCCGLSKCRGEIKKVNLKDAESKRRTPCKLCYGE